MFLFGITIHLYFFLVPYRLSSNKFFFGTFESPDQEIFKKELEQNISIIPTTKYVERLKTVGCELNQEYEENYGLKVKEKILESRKLLKNEQKGQSKISFLKKSQFEIKENIPPNQRIHTDYESIKFAKSKKKSISNKKSG